MLPNKIKYQQHPFHIVSPTSVPFITALGLFFFVLSILAVFYPSYFKAYGPLVAPEVAVYLGLFFILVPVFQWGSDLLSDSLTGHHTYSVRQGLRYGFILFIVSEVIFFVSIFWAFLHLASIPSVHIGGVWPPLGIHTLDPRGIPLLNTVVLLSSGIFTVWAHRALIAGYREDAIVAILGACLLGLYFSWLQFIEYSLTDFSINDSVYGSVFFFATGFHGFHVMVGTVLLWFAYSYTQGGIFSKQRHLSFEFAAWYWHFVDVVWIFLYILLYWWGSALAR